MRKDPTLFRERFKRWKDGKDVYKAGKPVDDEISYKEIMKDVARENYKTWGYSSPADAWQNELSNPTYNYRGYYTDPQFYQNDANSRSHWPDKYKTPKHKTFSDESKYHGKVSDKNPYGLRGGLWVGDEFIPAAWLSRILPKFEGGADIAALYELPEVVIKPQHTTNLLPTLRDSLQTSFLYRMMKDAGLLDDDDDLSSFFMYNMLRKGKPILPAFRGGKDSGITKVHQPYYDKDGTLVRNVDAELPEVVISNDIHHKDWSTHRDKNEMLLPDYRSSYLRSSALKEAEQAADRYKKAKDDTKREEGFENLMKLTLPSTYGQAVTGKDFGTVGRLAFDVAAFGLPGLTKRGVQTAVPFINKTNTVLTLKQPSTQQVVQKAGNNLIASVLPDYRGELKSDYNMFRRFLDNGRVREIPQRTNAPTNNIDLTSNIIVNPDKRFMMFEPGRFINYDIGNMSVEEVVNTFGPETKYYKNLYDVAKAHNFEGKYAEMGKKAEFNILNRFAINKADPDIAKGIEEARAIYSIPEYRERFDRWGTLGDTFIDDALSRLDNVKLQGRSKSLPIRGLYGVHGGAYTTPDATTIGITNSDLSSFITDMIRHEANHVAHGLRRLPKWMEYHNEKIRPIIREGKSTTSAYGKYLDDMDEIVERSKTAVEYANKIRKEGETLDLALTRLADITDANIYNASIPADVRSMMGRFTKDSTLDFWKNFVGGVATPVGVGLGIYGATNL